MSAFTPPRHTLRAVAALVLGLSLVVPARGLDHAEAAPEGGPLPPIDTMLPPPLPELVPKEVKDLLGPLTAPPAAEPGGPHVAASNEPAPFWGLGSWVDLYDYGHGDSFPPDAIIDEMAARGVRTAYIQTARWNSPADIVNPGVLSALIERAHDRNMTVVGWYLPGFADIAHDVRRSLAVLQFKTPRGDRMDGFAPDIEDRAAVGGNRDAFNAGIVAYGRALRAAVPPGTVLGAIVPDAKNNERAPARWAYFPWPEIARDYDVVMPMAYWSVVKPQRQCLQIEMDAAHYTREVVDKTMALMGTARPIHVIGGIADCVTPQEVAGYAAAAREKGSVGGGLYDWLTNTMAGGLREPLWGAQVGLR